MPSVYLAVANAFRSVAADGEKQDGAEFGRDRPGKEMCRLLDIQQEAVDDRPGQAVSGQPFVTEPVDMEDKKKYAQPTGKLYDAFKGSQIIFLLHGLYRLVRGDTGKARYLCEASCNGRIWPVKVYL